MSGSVTWAEQSVSELRLCACVACSDGAVADDQALPVHGVAGAGRAEVGRAVRGLRRPGAQDEGAVRRGRTDQRPLLGGRRQDRRLRRARHRARANALRKRRRRVHHREAAQDAETKHGPVRGGNTASLKTISIGIRFAEVSFQDQYHFCYQAALEYLGSFDHYSVHNCD